MARVNATPPRAVLWDLDGTLADSQELHWLSWQEALGAEDVHITRDQFLASFGQRNDAILSAWLGAGANPDRIRHIGGVKEAAYRSLVESRGIEPLPGATEWVRTLRRSGWRQAIASSAPRLNVQVMHRALAFEGLIDVLVAAEDVRRGKPDPEVFLTAARLLGVTPDRCVVVEDAEAGIEAANLAGMRSVGVGRSEVGGADLVVLSLADLPARCFDELLKVG